MRLLYGAKSLSKRGKREEGGTGSELGSMPLILVVTRRCEMNGSRHNHIGLVA